MITKWQSEFLKTIVESKSLILNKNQNNLFQRILLDFIITNQEKQSVRYHKYDLDKDVWYVYDTDFYKIIYNESQTYHLYFSKLIGLTWRYSKTPADPDPVFCPLGPEILDLEISVNGCPTVGGKSCKFCYKNNTNAPATNMSFETFKKIVDSMPKCLYSIAFGITGVQTNPDFLDMMEYCRDNDIIPNYTLSGADLDEDMVHQTCKLCGAVAVSCYLANKQLCYDTIKRFHDCKNNMHINMHIVLSEEEEQLNHIFDVLNDIKDGKVIGLRNIVFLRIKPVGRAKNMNCKIHMDTYKKIAKFCFEHNIGFGFDSCSAKTVQKILSDIGKQELCECCEPCESSKFSSYINVSGEYWNCSFCERDTRIHPINVLDYNNFIDVWNNQEVVKMRNINCKSSCPMFDLDSND